MAPVCYFNYLGLVPYQAAWDLQNQLAAEIHSGERPPTLLLLEHPHTYTFGRRGNASNLLWDEAELHERGIEVHWVDRGGDVTYHGPGQLVGYPLLPLGVPSMQKDAKSDHLPQVDYISYLRKLEQVIISTLNEFGLKAEQQTGMTGVWISPASNPGLLQEYLSTESVPLKIASIGVKVDSHGISRHGFALNVEPDMSFWEGIIACGLQGYGETSLAEILSEPPEMNTVIEKLVASFGEQFRYQMVFKPL